MERIPEIKKQINDKKGKEWIGLQTTTEKQLESLLWYLEHPKLQENSKLLEEIIEFYYIAKASGFTKMEGIIRKLDQLTITLGKFDYAEEEKEIDIKPKFLNYVQAIKELRSKIEILMQSPYGTSLPENTQKSIIEFINYLNHPDLHKKPNLFDDIYEKYEEAKESDFMKMQTFNTMLNMLEIKLGPVTKEMKKYKTLEEKIKDFEDEKKRFSEEWDKLKGDQEILNTERESLVKEKEKLSQENNKLKDDIDALKKEWDRIEEEKAKLKQEKEILTKERENLSNEFKKLESEWQKLETIKDKAE
ncbi:MAG: hypothetical protein EU532_02520 [Promethearchaeota archaeon]|nr:MAG: hypothetical protein EU532_02520 [Candidatus Lokiarchaeota archaeon]